MGLSDRIHFPIETIGLKDLQFGLDKIVEERLRSAPVSPHPLFVHMLGIPGSGKTVFARPLFECLERKVNGAFTYVGFDDLMSDIPQYQSSQDRVAAFSAYELPARAAGYALLKGLLEKRANILFDHGGASSEHVDILRYAIHSLEYSAFMVHVKCDAKNAIKRIIRRAEIEGRHTPIHYVEDRKKLIDALLPRYLEILQGFTMLDSSDDYVLYQNELVAALAEVILCCTTNETHKN